MAEPQLTCKREGILATTPGLCALNIKWSSMVEPENPSPCHYVSSTEIFWLCTFNRQPLIYKIHNIYCPAVKIKLMFLKQLDMVFSECHEVKRGFIHSALRSLFKPYELKKILVHPLSTMTKLSLKCLFFLIAEILWQESCERNYLHCLAQRTEMKTSVSILVRALPMGNSWLWDYNSIWM